MLLTRTRVVVCIVCVRKKCTLDQSCLKFLFLITKKKPTLKWRVRFIVFNVTFNNMAVISWRSILLVEETGVPGENHRPVVSH